MLQDTVSTIESRIQNSSALGVEQREELLKLLAQLRAEVHSLSKTHEEEAESIAAFAESSAREAIRTRRNEGSLGHSIGGLQSSVAEFETTHPELAGAVNRIANVLSNMGI